MIMRALSSATAALAVTTGLLYIMQFLITTGEDVTTKVPSRHFLEWVRLKETRDTPVRTELPKKPDKPELPPITKLAGSSEPGTIGVGIPVGPPVVRSRKPTFGEFGTSDGPLINIIKVQPLYPTIATTRGLDGTVTVQFDVSAIGTVENVTVIHSTNRIFNKAAIEAAYRFKYKPKVIDGTRYGATGLRQLFRFEMEK